MGTGWAFSFWDIKIGVFISAVAYFGGKQDLVG